MNKKQTYNKIMNDVSKIIKKHLNEELSRQHNNDIDDSVMIEYLFSKAIEEEKIHIIGFATDNYQSDMNDMIICNQEEALDILVANGYAETPDDAIDLFEELGISYDIWVDSIKSSVCLDFPASFIINARDFGYQNVEDFSDDPLTLNDFIGMF